MWHGGGVFFVEVDKKNTSNMVTRMHLMGDVYYYLYICVCIYALVWVFGLRILFPNSTLDPAVHFICKSIECSFQDAKN